MRIGKAFSVLRELWSLPEVTIRIAGDDAGSQMFRFFTKPHPRYKIIQNKRWGVGLLRLPSTYEEYMRGRGRQVPRTNRRRAERSGFRFRLFDPREHLDEILDINSSMPERQGRPMVDRYFDRNQMARLFKNVGKLYGVFNSREVLRAYVHAPVVGEVCVFSEILGHGKDLEAGIMYLLACEVIRDAIERKAREGNPLWAMYDMFFGAQSGLRYFKERLGFQPFKVQWVLERPRNGRCEDHALPRA